MTAHIHECNAHANVLFMHMALDGDAELDIATYTQSLAEMQSIETTQS